MVTPEIIMGISLLIFFAQLFALNGSLGQIALAHITFCISYVAITVRARAANMDPRLEEAARDLGDGAVGAFWHVTVPIIAPAIAAGAMLAFALSFDDLIVTSFNAGVGSTTLPIYIYSSIKFGVTPQINAISALIVGVVMVALVVAWRLGAFRGESRQVVDEEERRAAPRAAPRGPGAGRGSAAPARSAGSATPRAPALQRVAGRSRRGPAGGPAAPGPARRRARSGPTGRSGPGPSGSR